MPLSMTDTATTPQLTVDLAALSRNLDAIRKMAKGADVAPVVKANAYGLGVLPITKQLVTQCGVETVFVATAAEASFLQESLDRAPTIYVLNGPFPGEAQTFKQSQIRPVLNSMAQIQSWLDVGGGPCGIGIDIGMNRLGIGWDEVSTLLNSSLSAADVHLVEMHLSHSGSPGAKENEFQASRYRTVVDQLRATYPNAKFSLSASGGLSLGLDVDQQLVRPGLILYGGAADGLPEDALETVATLTAPVIMTRDVAVGEKVGYNGRWRAVKPSKIAILSFGYADGYHRALTNKGVVFLGGAECPVVGTVSMDLIAVDITDAPEAVNVGHHGELFGDQIKVDRLATLADTISYELFTSLGPRIERIYAGMDVSRKML